MISHKDDTMRNKLVGGIGLNDADYVVKPLINGKRVWCPFYQAWDAMIKRCSDTYWIKTPSCRGNSVCEEWKVFSNFKAWMQTQDWQGKDLDKDLLVEGNKHYSPETSVFVSHRVNTFIICGRNKHNDAPVGVKLFADRGSYLARCKDPFTGKEWSKTFKTLEEASQAYYDKKHELACKLAESQTDPRVVNALKTRFLRNRDRI